MSQSTYTCTHCKGAFEKGWSDEEAVAETRAAFGDHYANNLEETCDVICDDCHQKFLRWRAGLSAEEERRISSASDNLSD